MKFMNQCFHPPTISLNRPFKAYYHSKFNKSHVIKKNNIIKSRRLLSLHPNNKDILGTKYNEIISTIEEKDIDLENKQKKTQKEEYIEDDDEEYIEEEDDDDNEDDDEEYIEEEEDDDNDNDEDEEYIEEDHIKIEDDEEYEYEYIEEDKETIPPRPGLYQQTLWRSFCVNGLGLHTGELACVRVRPAFAGEGRYFVRMPKDANIKLSGGDHYDVQIYPEPEVKIDEKAEDIRSELFLKYLQVKDRDCYVGTFPDFLEDYCTKEGLIGEGVFRYEQMNFKEREKPIKRSETEPYVIASIDNIKQDKNKYNTTLINDDMEVSSVEHLLAALEACGIDNARIEIENGNEVPILDGSALGWAIEIENAGVTYAYFNFKKYDTNIEMGVRKVAIKPTEIISLSEGESFITLVPSEKMKLTYGIDHYKKAPVIGKQWFSWCMQEEIDFKNNVSAAKSFVSSPLDLYDMRDEGYVKGGSEGIILIAGGHDWYDERYITYPFDEPAKHKLIDLLGDLSLLSVNGMPGIPYGHIIAFNADHNLHLKFAKLIKDKFGDNYEKFIPVNLEDLPEDKEEEEDNTEEDVDKIEKDIDILYE